MLMAARATTPLAKRRSCKRVARKSSSCVETKYNQLRPATRLTRHPPVIHGCGVSEDGSGMSKSPIKAVRHEGTKNHECGRNAIVAKTTRASRTQLIQMPRDRRGGRIK